MNDPAAAKPAGTAHTPIRRGLIAGVAAATVLALWFFVIDGLAGRAFHTPAFLARVVLGGDERTLDAAQIAIYTILHYAAFMAVGAAVAWLMNRFRVLPGLLLGLILGFLLFDLLFYGSLWLTGTDVVGYLGWTSVLVGNAIAGVTLVGVILLLSPHPYVSWAEVLRRNQVVREGLVVGLIGAAVVAGWFLLIDLIGGRLFFTPAALGSVILAGATNAAAVEVNGVTVLGYTALHIAAFLVTGFVAAGIVAFAEDRHAYVLLGAVLLFVTLETFFIGLLTVVAQWLLELIPWWSIAVGNLLAAAAMGGYLWRRHPALAAALRDPELERNVERDRSDRGEGAPGQTAGGGAAPAGGVGPIGQAGGYRGGPGA
ncbi:MAG TPA: hypothetical protein VMM12_04715 [Longimicrobiales bacterium]|nr:hypothetical protein [Longimicrobiales bacterium]